MAMASIMENALGLVLIIMLPLSLILVEGFDLQALGVWLSYPLADFASSILSILLIKRVFIRLNGVLE